MPRDLFHRVTTVNQQTFGLSGDSGLANLDQSLTINGSTVAPTFIYEGKNADASAWTATIGEDLAIAGSGSAPTIGAGAPFTNSVDKAARFNGGEYYEAATDVNGITTEDFVIELLYKPDYSSGNYYGAIGKWEATGTIGWVIEQTVAGSKTIEFVLRNGATSVAVTAPAASLTESWNHIVVYGNRDEASVNGAGIIINGSQVKAANISALSGTTLNASTSRFDIGTNPSSKALVLDAPLCYAGMWLGADMIQAGATGANEIIALAAERFAKLTGTYASLAKGTAAPILAARNSTAHLDINRNGVVELYRVGAFWMRKVRRRDASVEPKLLTGHLVEEARTNKLIYSHDLNGAGWTPVNSSVAATSVVTPFGESTDVMIHEDATAGAGHRIQINVSGLTASTQYTLSFYAKSANRRHLINRIFAAGLDAQPKFNIETGEVIDSDVSGDVDIMHTPEPCGKGWFRYAFSITTPPGITTITSYHYILSSASDTIGTTWDGLDQDSLALVGVQCEAGAFPTGPIRTSGAAATRIRDVPEYKMDDGNVGDASEWTVSADVIIPDGNAQYAAIYSMNDNSLSNRMVSYALVTNGQLSTASLKSGGESGGVSSTSDIADGKVHAIRTTLKTNSLRQFLDNVEAGTEDTLVDVPPIDRLGIGIRYGNDWQINGVIGNVKVHKKAIPDKVIASSWENLYMANYGGMGAVAQSTATALTQDTYGKLTLGATADASNNGFTFASDVLTYAPDDKVTRNFLVSASVSFTGDNSAQCHLAVGKNGTAIEASEKQRTLSATASVGNCGLVYQVQLADGDTIEIQGRSNNATPDITVQDVFVTIVPVLE